MAYFLKTSLTPWLQQHYLKEWVSRWGKQSGQHCNPLRNSLEQSPGRFNFIEGYSQTILLDNATHVPSCAALVGSLGRIKVSGRRICMYETMGNRPNWHYTELGEMLGSHFDHFICYDHVRVSARPCSWRNFVPTKAGLIHAGVSPDCIDTAQGYIEATKQLSQVVGKNDLAAISLVVSTNTYPCFVRISLCARLKKRNCTITGTDIVTINQVYTL